MSIYKAVAIECDGIPKCGAFYTCGYDESNPCAPGSLMYMPLGWTVVEGSGSVWAAHKHYCGSCAQLKPE